jgi:hypothetical protein
MIKIEGKLIPGFVSQEPVWIVECVFRNLQEIYLHIETNLLQLQLQSIF